MKGVEGDLAPASLLSAPARLPLGQGTAALLLLTIVDGELRERIILFQLLNHSNLVIKLSIAILELVDPDLNQQLVREEELHKEPTSPPGWHIHQHLKGWHF